MVNKIDHCILSTAQMGEADRITISDLEKNGGSGADLMEAAGLSVVREITKNCNGSKVLVLCGPGNNGGDGFVIARLLKEAAWKVDIALLGEIKNLTGDAKKMSLSWDGTVLPLDEEAIGDHDVIIDAVFGTGLSKDINGELGVVLNNTNQSNAYKIAVDIPSGVKGDTGEVLGTAFKADMTVTFCRPKLGHFLFPGKAFCGEVIVTDIGISERTIKDTDPHIFHNHPDLWLDKLPRPTSNYHKYNRGHAVVVSGDMIHTGASRLAAKAALRVGAGLVSVSSPSDALSTHAAHLTSVMIKRRSEIISDLEDDRSNAWCIGPAAGVDITTRKNVLEIIRAGKKVVVDADAITVFGEGPLELFEAINANEKSQCVLTPHVGEFAKLFPYLHKLDKITATQNAAKLAGAVIIYKGPDTVIASPDGQIVISTNGPATLATAGSGDVLSGLITGLLAQEMPIFEAACAANWIHGECAIDFGYGLISEDLIEKIPKILSQLFGDK